MVYLFSAMIAEGKIPGKNTIVRFFENRSKRKAIKAALPDNIEDVGQYRQMAKMVRDYERTIPVMEREG